MEYATCCQDDVVVFDKDGNHIDGSRKPTIEKDMHIFIYQARPDINAILHTHPLYSTVFASLQMDIPAITEEFAQVLGRKVICSKYFLPGSEELAKAVVEALGKDRMACLLVSHGALCAGENMNAAFKASDVLEKASQIYYMAKVLGQPRIIPDDEVDFMNDFFHNKYGQR